VVPDFEFIVSQLRSRVSNQIPAHRPPSTNSFKQHANQLTACFPTKSKRSQMLLKFVEEFKGGQQSSNFVNQDKPQLDIHTVLEKKNVMLITLDTLLNVLGYLEAVLPEWHIERGLQMEHKSRQDIMVMTTKEKDSLSGITNSKGFRQEIFEFGTRPNGYFVFFDLSLGP